MSMVSSTGLTGHSCCQLMELGPLQLLRGGGPFEHVSQTPPRAGPTSSTRTSEVTQKRSFYKKNPRRSGSPSGPFLSDVSFRPNVFLFTPAPNPGAKGLWNAPQGHHPCGDMRTNCTGWSSNRHSGQRHRHEGWQRVAISLSEIGTEHALYRHDCKPLIFEWVQKESLAAVGSSGQISAVAEINVALHKEHQLSLVMHHLAAVEPLFQTPPPPSGLP